MAVSRCSLLSTYLLHGVAGRPFTFGRSQRNGLHILCLWFRASLIYISNCPTRCNTKQSVYYSASSLYMFRVSTTPIIRSTQNCNYSLRYWSYFLCSYLPPTWPSLATLEGGSCTVPEAVVTVLCTLMMVMVNTRNM